MTFLRRAWSSAFLSALLLAISTVGQAAEPRKVAFLVGVSKYDKSGFDNLQYAESDMQDLSKALKDNGFQVQLLLGGSSGKDKATRDNLRAALDDDKAGFLAKLKQLNKSDLALVAMSGHGMQLDVLKNERRVEDAFFCPVDALKSDSKTLLSLSDLMEQVGSQSGSECNLFVIDACRDNPGKGAGIDGSRVSLPKANMAALFGASSGTRSYESDKLGSGHGLLSYYLLEGLKGKAKDEDNEVTWGSLTSYVTKNVSRNAQSLVGNEQVPHSISSLKGAPPVIARIGLTADAQRLIESEFASFKKNITTTGNSELFRAKVTAEQIERWAQAARAGFTPACILYGVCLNSGTKITMDKVEAVRWFRNAAEQGDAVGQECLGTCYYNGEGVTKDRTEAVRWYRKAADQSNAEAQFHLGNCYYSGEGVAKDEAEAVRWYRKVADRGYVAAQFNLGVCYYNGEGVVKDLVEAARWYRKAADQGVAGAQFNLGGCYYNGEGVAKNLPEAVRWYRMAADQGEAEAQFRLGSCYNSGEGVAKDKAEAVRWYRKAAEQDDTDAKRRLKDLEK